MTADMWLLERKLPNPVIHYLDDATKGETASVLMEEYAAAERERADRAEQNARKWAHACSDMMREIVLSFLPRETAWKPEDGPSAIRQLRQQVEALRAALTVAKDRLIGPGGVLQAMNEARAVPPQPQPPKCPTCNSPDVERGWACNDPFHWHIKAGHGAGRGETE